MNRLTAVCIAIAACASVAPRLDAGVVTIPYKWKLRTTGKFEGTARANAAKPADSDSLNGTFEVTLDHKPPAVGKRLDDLPTQITLRVTAHWTGSLNTGVRRGAQASASVTDPSGFPMFTPAPPAIVGPEDSLLIDRMKSKSFQVGAGSTPYNGDVGAFITGGTPRQPDLAVSSLDITGDLTGMTDGNIRYLVPVPPAAYAGAVTLVVAGVAWRRARKSPLNAAPAGQ